jgi:hypothetical protein
VMEKSVLVVGLIALLGATLFLMKERDSGV